MGKTDKKEGEKTNKRQKGQKRKPLFVCPSQECFESSGFDLSHCERCFKAHR
jgi:hypothetical protein